MKSAKRVIVALDVETADEARDIVAELRDDAAAFKIGLQLFMAAGPDFVRELSADNRVFLDLKFHDIPTTVANAGIEAARLGAWMFNVHSAGGSEMMRRTMEEVGNVCTRESIASPLVIGVTVLTSSTNETLQETGVQYSTDDQVVRLAKLTAESGLNGVVASPLEAGLVRNSVSSPDFLIVTPGVRPVSATNDDQKRVMTPGRAVAAGSDFVVIGRPIVRAKDGLEELQKIQKEIDEVRAS